MTQPFLQQQLGGNFGLDNSTWLIADTHFFHANIGQYCDRPDGWQDLIIENWNRFIQPGEIVLHLGDLALGQKEDTEALVPLLNGKLYLMRGNHDRRSKVFYANLGITLVKDPYSMAHSSGQRLIFSHRLITPLEPGVFNLHGHIHNHPSPEVGPRHINLSVEVREYRPWRLGEILRLYVGKLSASSLRMYPFENRRDSGSYSLQRWRGANPVYTATASFQTIAVDIGRDPDQNR